jgi:hypothetical protein
MPRYPRSGVVNSPPFVSGPPRAFDACYMYRPANGCNEPCGSGASGGYAGNGVGGSPFAYVPPTYMPSGLYRSPPYPTLLGFGQTLNNAYLSRGIYGQPKAYIDGQPFRNFFRYLSL